MLPMLSMSTSASMVSTRIPSTSSWRYSGMGTRFNTVSTCTANLISPGVILGHGGGGGGGGGGWKTCRQWDKDTWDKIYNRATGNMVCIVKPCIGALCCVVFDGVPLLWLMMEAQSPRWRAHGTEDEAKRVITIDSCSRFMSYHWCSLRRSIMPSYSPSEESSRPSCRSPQGLCWVLHPASSCAATGPDDCPLLTGQLRPHQMTQWMETGPSAKQVVHEESQDKKVICFQ